MAFCKRCGSSKHWTLECSVRQDSLTKPEVVRQRSLTEVKKVWVKPEIRRYVRVPSLTGDPFVKLGEVVKFDKRAYQREYMRKKRELSGL